MHRCHARPSLPVVPDPILTPPNLYGTGLHHTAAKVSMYLFLSNPKYNYCSIDVINVIIDGFSLLYSDFI